MHATRLRWGYTLKVFTLHVIVPSMEILNSVLIMIYIHYDI